MFTVITVLDPLTGGSTTKEYEWEKGKSLSEYVGYDDACIIACNQQAVTNPLSRTFPARKEVYTVMAIPTGVAKSTWAALGGMMSTASSFIPGWGKVALFVGANLLALYLRDKDKDQDTSQSYSWGHVSSPSAAKGIAMPIVYGKARVRPILKNRYVTVDGDKQMLYGLYSVAAHRVDERALPVYLDSGIVRGPEVTYPGEPGRSFENTRFWTELRDTTEARYNLFRANGDLGKGWKEGHGTASFASDILINGRAIQDYHDDVRWETRPGLAEQAVITDFDVTYTNTVVDTALYLNNIATVNRNEIVLGYTTRVEDLIFWRRHALSVSGVVYTLDGSAIGFTNSGTNYVYFDTDVSLTTYQVQNGAEPTGDTQYVVASFSKGGSVVYNCETALPTGSDWTSPVVSVTDAHNIELTFEFPQGLYGLNREGGLVENTCRLFIQYKNVNATAWSNFYSNFTIQGDNEIADASGVNIYYIRRGKQDAFYIVMRAVQPAGVLLDPKEAYEVRVTASCSSSVKLVNVATVVYGEEDEDGDWPGFTYPGEPLLGIKALASGQVNGQLDVQVDVERSNVWVYNGTTWVEKDANNHAWAVYDILVNGYYDDDTGLRHPTYPYAGNEDGEAVYGCGISPERLDYDSFNTWATNIETLGYELNTVFDTFMTAWDAILRICQEGRGMVYTVGATIYAFTDKAATPTQLFTAGNIHADTFVRKYTGTRNKANAIEASFYDAERNYEKTLLIMRTADWDSSTDVSIPESITLYGTTSSLQAESIARFLLTGNELLNTVVSFGVDVDALAAQAGDVVEIQHDLLSTGQGGRIVSVVEDPGVPGKYTITFDRTLSISTGQQYQLKIYHNDGTIETQTGITGGSDTAAIVFGTGWSWDKVPEKYEPYSFGVSGAHTKQYRITEISRTTELMRTLTLVQYSASLYDVYAPGDTDTGIDSGRIVSKLVPVTSGAIGDVAATLNIASNLRLQETLSRNRLTGEYESSIVATWDTVTGDPRGKWEVWFRDVDATDVDWQGEWAAGTYDYDNKVEKDGKTYISTEDNNTSIPFLVTDE